MSTKSNSRLFWFDIVRLPSVVGWKNSRHFFNQSEVKPKPIVTCSHAFSSALRWLNVFPSSSDCFIVLFASVVMGQSDYFCSGFMRVK